MKKLFNNVLEWVKQHRKAAIGIAAGCVVFIAAAVAAVVGIVGAVTTGGRLSANGLTREQWIKLYGGKLNINNYEQAEPYYSYVKSDSEVFGYVQAFVENQIMSGDGKAELDKKVTFEEALIQLARYYGDNYIKGATGKNELTDADRLEFLKKDAEINIENVNRALDEEKANELLDLVWNSYLNREFRNINKINYAENVIDLSTVKDYEYADDKLVVKTDKDIAEGKVLVLGENDEYIAGLALKVTKVSRENGIYTLDVVTPEINEIADDFYLEVSQVIDFEGFEPAEGVTIEEIGTESAGADDITNHLANKENDSNSQSQAANGENDGNGQASSENGENVIKPEGGEALSAKFDVGRSGKFLKLNLDFTKGTVSTSAVWEKLGAELELKEPELYQYGVDENGKLISKFDDSGFKVKGGLTLKDLVLNGEVDFGKGVKFDFNAGVTAQPSLSIEGNGKGKQIWIGKQNIPLAFGFCARIDINLYVDFKGQVSVKPEFTGMVNINGKSGKAVNATGKCESNFKSEIKCEAKVKVGPDFVINCFGIDVMDAYVYFGLGADTTYSVKNPQKIVVDVYAPTLEVGVCDKDNTFLRKIGVKKGKIKLVDKKDAPFKCPFTAQYTYDILTKKTDYSQEIQSPEEESSDGSGETAANENDGTNATDGNNQSGGSSGDNSSGGSSGGSSGSDGSGGETQKPTESTGYRLSEESYDYAELINDNFYLVKQNGKYGAVDFAGNVKVPIVYEKWSSIVRPGKSIDEVEFINGDNSYIYNTKTGKQVYSYKNHETYKGDIVKFEISKRGNHLWVEVGKYEVRSTSVKRGYLRGIVYSYTDYEVQQGPQRNCNLSKIEFFDIANGKVLFSGYINPVERGSDFGGVALNKGYSNSDIIAFADCFDFNTEENITYKISKNGVEKINQLWIPNAVYTDGYIKGIDGPEFYSWIADVTTNGVLLSGMYGKFKGVGQYYCGRGEYWGIKRQVWLPDGTCNEGETLLLKGEKVLASGLTSLDFSSDKYIIATKSGKAVFLDYNGKEHMSVESSGRFHNGKALVYNGTGIYYIDESLNKVSDYIYKGKVDACGASVVQINGKCYLISK